MAFLLSDSERYELRPGTNTLGGRGEDAVPHTLLNELTPVAVITVRPGTASLIRRLSHDAVVRVDGESVGGTPRTLRHGARLDVGRCHLVYDDAAADGSDPSVVDEEREMTSDARTQANSTHAGSRLVALRSGREYPVPERGLVIGRDSSCDIVVLGKSVSRRHADIARDPKGYAVTNHSANGTIVNGERLDGSRLLQQGDAIRVGKEEFRFETGSGSLDSTTDGGTSPESLAALTRPAPHRDPAAAPPPQSSLPALASLKVIGGTLGGTRFRVERPVCAIGRTEDNDVRIADDSVSASHATLLLKSGTWYVVDLRSSNGTYVDGYRVAGERELPPGCTLRIGSIEMKFRPVDDARGGRGSTRRIVGR
jgi:pSer/pThr/pTyr-binding forkhead associated (FHA) protein